MKKVIVIGGGFAGSTAARILEKYFSVTLIDNKNYFEFTPGILRTIVEPDHIKKVQVLHHNYLKRTKVVIDEVVSVNDGKIKLKDKELFYDYLVICSGSKYNLPIKEHVVLATRAEHLRAQYTKLCEARRVLIIGGGLVGIELAAEICTHYKDKEVSIIHMGSRLIERNTLKASKYAHDFLTNKGVMIMLNEKVIKSGDGRFYTDKGSEFIPDISFLCTGIVPNFEFLHKNYPSVISAKNQIKVNEYMQVVNQKNIFAAGDVNDALVEKTAQNAEKQARIAAKNIMALEKGKQLTKYIPQKTPIIISLGKRKGILEHEKFVLTGFIPGLMKGLVEMKEMWKLR